MKPEQRSGQGWSKMLTTLVRSCLEERKATRELHPSKTTATLCMATARVRYVFRLRHIYLVLGKAWMK